MESQTDKLSTILSRCLDDSPIYAEALKLVQNNSNGKVWLVGGAIFRTLIYKLYGKYTEINDWDFIVDQIKNPLTLPDDWADGKNKYGNPRVKKASTVVDIIPLSNIECLKIRKLTPTIENYLLRVPWTIQRLAYDADRKLFIGSSVGVRSILTKTIAINDLVESAYLAERKGYEVKRLLAKIADELGLTVKT